LLSFVADFLPGTESQKIWFSGMPVIYLIDYDYLALLAILVFISFSDKFMSLKKFKLLSLGLLTFLIFEFLPLFLLFFFYFLRPQKIKRYMIPLLFPGFFMIFVTHFFSRNKEYRTLIETYMFYGQSNLSNPLGLLVISIIVLAPAVFIGMLFRILLIKFDTQRNITSKKNYQKTYTAAIKSLILIHTISLFTSGVTSEFGRQSLGIQVCLFLFIVNLVGHKQKSQT
jgi:hypothetical protein